MTNEDTILGLIAATEEQKKAVASAIEGLAAERAALDRAVKGFHGDVEVAVWGAARQSLAGVSKRL